MLGLVENRVTPDADAFERTTQAAKLATFCSRASVPRTVGKSALLRWLTQSSSCLQQSTSFVLRPGCTLTRAICPIAAHAFGVAELRPDVQAVREPSSRDDVTSQLAVANPAPAPSRTTPHRGHLGQGGRVAGEATGSVGATERSHAVDVLGDVRGPGDESEKMARRSALDRLCDRMHDNVRHSEQPRRRDRMPCCMLEYRRQVTLIDSI